MTYKILLVGLLSVAAVIALFVSLSLDNDTNNDISPQSEPYNYEDICGYPVTHEMRLDILSKSKVGVLHDDPPYLDLHPGNFTHVERSQYLTDVPLLQYWFELQNGKQVYFEMDACDIDGSTVSLATIGPGYKDWKTPDDADFDTTKYEVLAAPGSPLIYKDTLMPVLDVENCKRVAEGYTKAGEWNLYTRKSTDFEAPWKDQVFPLMDYCTSIGKYELKTLDGNINWNYTIQSPSGSKYTEIDVAKKLLSQNQIEYIPDKIIVASGPSLFDGDPRCGAVIDVNSVTHWFAIDSISKPQNMTIFSENPNPCKVNTESCFCGVQMELAVLTLDDLSYFSSEEEEKVANTLIDYLVKENINRTPKFMIGKFNLNYTDPAAIGYCGELWGYNTIDYFDGAIVNAQVADYGLEKELSPLCAIAEGAKWWEKK